MRLIKLHWKLKLCAVPLVNLVRWSWRIGQGSELMNYLFKIVFMKIVKGILPIPEKFLSQQFNEP